MTLKAHWLRTIHQSVERGDSVLRKGIPGAAWLYKENALEQEPRSC